MKKRRGYLKHYNDATAGITIQTLLMKKKPYSVLLHWYILERCNQLDSNIITISLNELRFRMHRRSDALLKDISALCEESEQVSFELLGDNLEIMVANYTEYQENRGGKRDIKSKAKEPTLKIKDKRLKIKDKRLKNKGKSKPSFERDLESIYLTIYPRKVGKTKGLARLAKEIKSNDDLMAFRKAAMNYKDHCHLNGTETQFIKHFSTFVSEWRDWVEVVVDQANEFVSNWRPKEERDATK